MNEKENVTINILMPENIPCKNCVWATTPYARNCVKFQPKKSEVLYDGKSCPEQKPFKNKLQQQEEGK